jgi:hypothetical protein
MATITINTPAGEDATNAADIGEMLFLGRSATAAEVKADVIATYKQKLKAFRAARAATIAAASASEPSMT